MINTRDTTALAEGLKILASSTAMPQVYYCDREGGLEKLARSAKWIILENGLLSQENLVLTFCPAPGSAHVNHSGVERKVKSVKAAIGKLNLTDQTGLSISV